MVTTDLINTITALVDVDLQFIAGQDFFWSPEQRTITYKADLLDQDNGRWAMLHEVAHAVLLHQTYQTDYDLLLMEVAAWGKAQDLAKQLGISIDKEHIEDCLDTYRDWLHERSTCPTCSTVSLQLNAHAYRCHNCHTNWQVSTSRFCRPYRLTKTTVKEKSPEIISQTTFA